MELLSSAEDVVKKSDFIIVLAPNNPERHMDLSLSALSSGKRVYVDKTFAPDFKTAVRMIETAEQNKTPMFSTSALRYVPEINEYLEGVGRNHPAEAVTVRGPNSFEIYGVHQFEIMVMLLGLGAREICCFGGGKFKLFIIKYDDKRLGAINVFEPSCVIEGKPYGHPFEASLLFDTGALSIDFSTADMFKNLVKSICLFFDGSESPAPYADTLEIMALLEAGNNAVKQPGKWVHVPAR